jgi:pimeloyl-ACP methyl ester carboxylesterase
VERRTLITLALAGCLLSGALAPAAGHHREWHKWPKHKQKPKPAAQACQDSTDEMHELALPMHTGIATGLYALPQEQPTGLVIFDHGYGHTSRSWTLHMEEAAKRGLIAVTPDYRGIQISPDSNGDGLPESRGWDVMAGAEDTVAAAQYFERHCKAIDKIVVFGVSMGGNTSGLAVAMAKEARRSNGAPLFDYWVDVEGAVNVIETYFGARLLAPVNTFAANAKADIEREMGGTFEENPEEYQRRTVVSRIDDIKASGVKGVVLVHGVDDGLVPYNQSREMAGLLAGAEIPYDMFTVGRESQETDKDTTATGYIGGQIDKNYDSPLAGHASEKSQVHIVMTTAFDRLWDLFGGGRPGPAREYLVDGEEGTFPAN